MEQVFGPTEDQSYRRARPPRYPPQSRRMREEGTVVLRVLVSASGDPLDIQIETSSGHRRLDQAAQDAVKKWKFNPGRRSGQPVEGWVLVPINFSLTG